MSNRSCINLVGNTTEGQNLGNGCAIYNGKVNTNTLSYKTLSTTGTSIQLFSDNETIYISGASGGGTTDLVTWTSFEFRDITAGISTEYTIDIKASVPYIITSGVFQVNDGTLDDISVKVNSTDISGLSGVTASTTITEYNATSPYNVNVGDIMTIYVGTTYTGDPSFLRGKINITYS